MVESVVLFAVCFRLPLHQLLLIFLWQLNASLHTIAWKLHTLARTLSRKLHASCMQVSRDCAKSTQVAYSLARSLA